VYLWVKAFHIIAMVAWMASLLAYPRFKLQQLSSQAGEPLFESMKSTTAELQKSVMNPAIAATWVLGITLLVLNPYVFQSKYIWLKLLLVFFVSAAHSIMLRTGRAIDEGDASVDAAKLKMLSGMPFFFLIFIVILIVIKPF